MSRGSDATIAASQGGIAGRSRAAFESVVMLAVFAAAGAWPVPDVNETAYLTKARHVCDPAWGRNDFFLETPDAHGVFSILFGPVTARLPLERAAWIGRWLGWLALAFGFRYAVVPLVSGTWPRVLAAALFSLAMRHTTAAGEWVIGGCEAKVFAWALEFTALGSLARGRPAAAWLALGGATAVHPIVGGWGLVSLAGWLVFSKAVDEKRPGIPVAPSWSALAVGAGLLLAAAGILPAVGLSAGADAATRTAAARIYVVDRLPHHLLPRGFADGMLARHLLAAVVWWLLSRLSRAADGSPPGVSAASRQRVDRFILATLGIAAVGHAIAAFEPVAPHAVYGLLRFYWFRLADVLVAFGLATAVAATVSDTSLLQRLVPLRPAVTRWLVVMMVVVDMVHESRHWPLPGRAGLAARSDAKVEAAAWRDACEWVAAHTPQEATFLTPRGAASFTWWTGRCEVVGWKNSPQDARSLVEWRRRFIDCFSRDDSFKALERSTAALGPERMREVARKYGATHAIVPRDVPHATHMPFDMLYANRGYLVYRLDMPGGDEGGRAEDDLP